jgi:hypothetical protein
MALRHFIHVDMVQSIPGLSQAQVLAISQTFPLTRGRLRVLYASAEFSGEQGAIVLPNTGGLTTLFIAFLFYAADGVTALDTLYLKTLTWGPSHQSVSDGVSDAKICQESTQDDFFVAGRGGYPDGAASVALVAGFSAANANAAAKNATCRLRAIMEAGGEPL